LPGTKSESNTAINSPRAIFRPSFKAPAFDWYFNLVAVFALSTLIFFLCYYVAWSRIHGKGLKSFLKFVGMFLTFFSIAMGFSVHNSLAVLEGHLGKRSEFIRTPKFNISESGDKWKGNKYLSGKFSRNIIIEGILFLYFGFAIFSAFRLQEFGLIIFHLMLFSGFGFVFIQSLKSEV